MTTARQSNEDEKHNNAISLNDAPIKRPGAHKVLGTLHTRQWAMLGDMGVSGMWGVNVVEFDGHC